VDVVVEASQTADGSVAAELTVVGAVVDERRTVAELVAVDGSVVGGVNGSVWPYWTVCLDHTCLASVSITREAAETTSWHNYKNTQNAAIPDSKSLLLTSQAP